VAGLAHFAVPNLPPLTCPKPACPATNLEQHVQGHCHEHHVKHVGGRGEDGRNDAYDQDGPPAIAGKSLPRHEAQAAHEDHGEGKLEDEAEPEEKQHAEGNELSHGNNGFDVLPFEAEKEFYSVRQGDIPAEQNPA